MTASQHIAAVIIGGTFYTVLVRPTKTGVALKLAGKRLYTAERLMEDESAFLAERPDLAARLVSGEVVKL